MEVSHALSGRVNPVTIAGRCSVILSVRAYSDLLTLIQLCDLNIAPIQIFKVFTLLLHVFFQVSPVGGLHYNGELHPIPTPQDGLAVSVLTQISSACDRPTLGASKDE